MTINEILNKFQLLSSETFCTIEQKLLNQKIDLLYYYGTKMYTKKDSAKANRNKSILAVAFGDEKYPELCLSKFGVQYLWKTFSELLGCQVKANINSAHYKYNAGVESFFVLYRRHLYFWSTFDGQAKVVYHCPLKKYNYLDYHDAICEFQQLFFAILGNK